MSSACRCRPNVVELPRCHRVSVTHNPETSINYAFFAHDAFTTEWWVLADRTDILVDLVLHHDFTVDWDI
jgi:hypothetical protein